MVQSMKGVRVLEVAEHTFVPAASAVLADWGADIIKVEHAERGDAMRGLGRTGVLDLSKGVHVILEHSNRGKRSIGIDLAKPEGLKILLEIAKTVDVFLTNKLPATLAKLGIDVDDLRAVNPKIIYVRGTAFGPRGPDANRGGYDMTAFWCRSGTGGALTSKELGVAPPGRTGLWRFPGWNDDRGWDRGRTLPKRANGGGGGRRRVAAGDGDVGDEFGDRAVSADGAPVEYFLDAIGGGQPAHGNLPDPGRSPYLLRHAPGVSLLVGFL